MNFDNYHLCFFFFFQRETCFHLLSLYLLSFFFSCGIGYLVGDTATNYYTRRVLKKKKRFFNNGIIFLIKIDGGGEEWTTHYAEIFAVLWSLLLDEYYCEMQLIHWSPCLKRCICTCFHSYSHDVCSLYFIYLFLIIPLVRHVSSYHRFFFFLIY